MKNTINFLLISSSELKSGNVFDKVIAPFEKRLQTMEGLNYRIMENAADEKDILSCGDSWDIIMILGITLSETVLASLPRLKLIMNWGSGYEGINLAEADKLGIAVTNSPNNSYIEVSEWALILILACRRKFGMAQRGLIKDIWITSDDLQPTHRYTGMTVGLLGFGLIAKELSWRLKALKIKILACDPYVPKEEMNKLGVEKVDEKTLFEQSDVLSIHIRLNDETFHYVNEEKMRTMKKGAVLVNISRGPIVDEEALTTLLQKGILGGTGLDVFEKEPLPEYSPLREIPAALLTPHCAATTTTSIKALIDEWITILQSAVNKNPTMPNQLNSKLKIEWLKP